MNARPPNTVHRSDVPPIQASAQGIAFYRYIVVPAVIALIYATFLTSLPIDNFVDRVNYFMYARTSRAVADFYSYSIISYLTNEPLWLVLNSFLYTFVSDETVIRIFIFVPAFVSAYLLAAKGRYNVGLICIALLVPGIVQNYIIHIRQGVAIAVFLLGFLSDDRRIRYTMILLAPFIHSAFFVVSPLFLVVEVANRFTTFNVYLRFGLIVLALTIIVAFLGVIMSSALVRQVDEYQNIDTEFSGLGFMFWSAILLLFVTEGSKFLERNMLQMLTMIFYLMIYFFAPFAGRVLECVLIPIFMAGMSLPSWKKLAFTGGIALYSFQFYHANSDLYWFGWGV